MTPAACAVGESGIRVVPLRAGQEKGVPWALARLRAHAAAWREAGLESAADAVQHATALVERDWRRKP